MYLRWLVVLGFILAAVGVYIPADQWDKAESVCKEFVIEDGGVGFKLDKLDGDGGHPRCVPSFDGVRGLHGRCIPIMARRRALAMLVSVPDRTNSQYSSVSWRICTCGSRRGVGAPGMSMADATRVCYAFVQRMMAMNRAGVMTDGLQRLVMHTVVMPRQPRR